MAKTPAGKKKLRNPQDSTLRNIRAARKREYALNLRVTGLEARVKRLEVELDEILVQQA